MKHFLLSAALIFSVAAHAQSDKYIAAMKQNLMMYDSLKTSADCETLAANFQRIGDAEKTQWLPYYWQAMVLSHEGWLYFPNSATGAAAAIKAPDLSAAIAQQASRINAALDKASALAADDTAKSEIYTVKNMAATQQMLVDPQSRYMTFGAEAGQDLQKAETLNPANPRAYYLQGMAMFGTPEQFGGGKAVAKPLFQKAVDLAKAENAQPLHPHWGLDLSEKMVTACGQ